MGGPGALYAYRRTEKLLTLEHSADGATLGEVSGGDRRPRLRPAPGYSTPFGILLFILALQMIYGRRTPWLPARAPDGAR